MTAPSPYINYSLNNCSSWSTSGQNRTTKTQILMFKLKWLKRIVTMTKENWNIGSLQLASTIWYENLDSESMWLPHPCSLVMTHGCSTTLKKNIHTKRSPAVCEPCNATSKWRRLQKFQPKPPKTEIKGHTFFFLMCILKNASLSALNRNIKHT